MTSSLAPVIHQSSSSGSDVIGDLIEATLAAAGKSPRSADLRDSGYQRAELAVNEIGPAYFPLITSVEERVIGTRPLVMPGGIASRARMFEIHDVMDVLSSVTVAAAANNIICDAVRAAVTNLPGGAEIIVDYQGFRRPPITCPPSASDYWAQGDWQLQMYAWLRSQQPGTAPVVAGALLVRERTSPQRSGPYVTAPSVSAARDCRSVIRLAIGLIR